MEGGNFSEAGFLTGTCEAWSTKVYGTPSFMVKLFTLPLKFRTDENPPFPMI